MSSPLAPPARQPGEGDSPAPPAPVPAWRVALAPWLVARVVAGLVLLAVWRNRGLGQAGDPEGATGLWVWDAAWYRAIAEQGYGELPGDRADQPQSLRFFPLLPLLGRLASPVFAGNVDLALLVLSSAAALAFAALLVRLVRLETGDEGVARRSAWLAMLAPGAGVLVLAYTEPISGALAVGFFLAVRRDRPGLAAALGFLSGLARPTGVLLTVVALLEAARWLRDRREQGTGPSGRPSGRSGGRPGSPAAALPWVAAIASPLAGAGAYGLWIWSRYGDPLLPYTVQTRAGLRGGVAVDPRPWLFTTIHHGLDWRLQLALLVAALALLVVVVRRLPMAYAAWSALTLAASVTSAEGHSLPRYIASTFPLLIGAAWVARGRRWPLMLLASMVLFGYVAFLGFTPDYVL